MQLGIKLVPRILKIHTVRFPMVYFLSYRGNGPEIGIDYLANSKEINVPIEISKQKKIKNEHRK